MLSHAKPCYASRNEGRQPSRVVATSLAQYRPTIQKQFCLNDVTQPLAKFATSVDAPLGFIGQGLIKGLL